MRSDEHFRSFASKKSKCDFLTLTTSLSLSSAHFQKCFKHHLGQHCSGVESNVDNWSIPLFFFFYITFAAPSHCRTLGVPLPLVGAVAVGCSQLHQFYFLLSDPKGSFVPNLFQKHSKHKPGRHQCENPSMLTKTDGLAKSSTVKQI